jgi:PAS domain-containing protein
MENSMQHSAHLLPEIFEGLSRQQIRSLASQSVDHVLEEGHVFRAAEALAAMEEFIKSMRKDERYIQYLRDELAKHQGRLTTQSGARLELCEAGVVYDYNANAEWRQLDARIGILINDRKELEERLRSIAPGRIAVDPDTGEMMQGANKTSRSTYRITLSP